MEAKGKNYKHFENDCIIIFNFNEKNGLIYDS